MVELLRIINRNFLRAIYLRNVASVLLCCFTIQQSWAADYSAIISQVKPSVVAIANYQPLAQPQLRFIGTGFVVADGRHLITNAHNIPDFLDPDKKESLAIVVAGDDEKSFRLATLVVQEKAHDVAILKFSDTPLPALRLGNSSGVKEGQEYLITGFPIGSVLGYHAVTHRSMISAITPVAQPVDNAKQLNPRLIKRMLTEFKVFQLDAIAYPGNSGSPVYSPDTGEVVGVLNSVFVKETKESVLERPSGISYAIPVLYVWELMQKAGLAVKPE
jgi:S1-C subfamily serine protease